MSLMILLPALASWAVIARWSVRKAFLAIYLPALLLLPQYYVLRAPHMPPVTFAEAAILPLGLAMLAGGLRGWRLDWMDLAVLLFPISMGLSEGLSAQLGGGTSPNPLGVNLADGSLLIIDGLMTMVLPYMAGKMLIERPDENGRNMRHEFAGRVALLMAVVAVFSIRDFITGGNTWLAIGGIAFPKQYVGWFPQTRWGFGRISGPYGQAILAGMIFLMGVCYCFWLEKVEPGWGGRKLFHGLPFTVRGLIMAGVLLGLSMTQSRGPWIGMGLALLFVYLTHRFPLAKAGVLFLLFFACFSAVAYSFGDKYTDVDINQASTEEQQNAIYRRDLITNYTPVVQERPLFGWGITTYPKIDGQVSIDNEYLLLAVTQGFFGLGVYLAIMVGSGARLFRFLLESPSEEDRLLIYAHMAVLIGLMTTLTTVYMGEQVVTMFFLFTGWVQGMKPALMRASVREAVAQKGAFRRVLA